MRRIIKSGLGLRRWMRVALYRLRRSSAISSGVISLGLLPDLLRRLFQYRDTLFHVRRRVVLVRLILDADVPLEFDLSQRPQHFGHVEHALAVNSIGLLCVIL